MGNLRHTSQSPRRTSRRSQRLSKLLLESLEPRTLLSATDPTVGAIPVVNATPTVSASPSPTKVYRIATLPGDTAIPTISAQSYFNALKQSTTPKPVLSQLIAASNITPTTVNLSAYATYAGTGGDSALTYTWTASAQPVGAVTIFSANGTFAAQQTTVTFDHSGEYTFNVTISDGSYTVNDNLTFIVSAVATTMHITPAGPMQLTFNSAQQFYASVFDQFGLPDSVPALFTSTGTGSISSSGLYQTSNTGGTAIITASVPGLARQVSISVGNPSPTIATPASASASTVTGSTVTLSVLGADDAGEAGLTYYWSLASAPTGSFVYYSNTGNNAAKSTVVTFNKAGAYSFYVMISDGTSAIMTSVSLTVAQTLSSIAVSPGSVSLGVNGTQNFSATAYDQFGAALSAQPTFTWTKLSGVGTINSAGTYSAGASAGSAVVRATSGGVSGQSNVAIGNSVPTIATAAAAANQTNTTASLSVLGADDGGAAALRYTWSLLSGPSGAAPLFSSNGTNASKNTTVTFNRAGSYTLRATISDGSLTVTSSVTLSVAAIVSDMTVIPGSVNVAASGTQQFSIAIVDQFNQSMTAPVTWSVDAGGAGAINSSGLFTAGASGGSAVVRAAASTVGAYALVTVVSNNSAPTITTAANASSTSVTGATVSLNTLGADNGGEPSLTYTWSLAAAPSGANVSYSSNGANASKNSVVTFNKAGAYTFTVTISDGLFTVQSSVSLNVGQTLTSIGVTPGSASIGSNATLNFSATAYDQFGAALAAQPGFIWTRTNGIGSINSSGTYSGGLATGTATIRATSGSVFGAANITVTNNAPTVTTPANAYGQTNSTVNLNVLGADDGGTSNLVYTWSLVSGPTGASPVYSANGTNSANNTAVTFNRAGTYTFLATISDGSLTTSSSVILTINQVASDITVTPGTSSLAGGATQQFSAAIVDQFNQTMITSLSWTVDSGGDGTVNSAGLFTAGGTSGSAIVRATAGSVSSFATITVTSSAPGTTVSITTRSMTSFSELLITGTTTFDTITVSQSGTTFTIVANGNTQTISGAFGDLVVHAGSAGSNITINSSVNINTLLYGGAGADTLSNHSSGAYTSIVAISGGNDVLSGNGTGTNYWGDTADTFNSATTENNAGLVNKISSFYQPWSSTPSNPDYVPLTLQGQNLRDPTDTGTAVHYTNASLWGTGPIPLDIRQWGIGDCYLIADLQSIAGATPKRLEATAVDLGDGTYLVRFYRYPSFSFVRVDADFGQLQVASGASGDIWGPVIEKAYAFYRTAANTYDSLNSGWMSTVSFDLNLNAESIAPTSASALATAITNAASKKEGLTVGTGSGILSSAPLVASHAYTIVGYTLVGGVYMFQLQNPWGFDGAGSDSNPNDGIVSLTWTQFTANFSSIVGSY